MKLPNDSNQNEASMDKDQPKSPVFFPQFLNPEDEAVDNITENISYFNSNPMTRIENDSEIAGSSEEITDNINNIFSNCYEDSDSLSYSKCSKNKTSNFVKKNHSHSKNFLYGNEPNCNRRQKHKSLVIISIIIGIINLIFDVLGTIFTRFKIKLSNWLLDYPKLDTTYSAIIKVPLNLSEQIFAWCQINICRQNKTNRLSSLPSVKIETFNWYGVVPKFVWPGLFILALCTMIIILNSYISKGESTSGRESCAGIQIIKRFYHRFLIDLKNTAGVECIRKNNCCSTKIAFLMRWIKCFLQQPFYVAMISETRPIIRRKLTIADYNDIVDWKLKRQMKKVSSIQKELQVKNIALTKKANSHLKIVEELKKLKNRNMSNINNLAVYYEAANDYLDEMMKDFEHLKSNIMTVETIKQNIVKNYDEIESCFKCTFKSTLTEIESFDKSTTETFGEHQTKINELKSKINENSGNNLFEKRIEIFKGEIIFINNKVINYQMNIENLEGLTYQTNNDFNALKKTIFGRLENHMMEVSQNNKKTVDQVQNNFKTIESRMKISPNAYENLYRHLIVGKYYEYYDYIKQKNLKIFCKNLENHIKFTIKNILAMNTIDVKKCSIIYINEDEVHFASQINLDNINKVNLLPCCVDKDSLQLKISERLENVHGYYDYALASNGGKVVEDSASNHFWFHTYSFNAKYLILSEMVYNRCWLLKKLPAYVTLQLSSKIKVSHISVGHISKELTFKNSTNDAPKDFKVYGLVDISDTDPKLLGDFTFKNSGSVVQTFKIKMAYTTKYIQLKIISNHGNINQTCVYKFKVYGHVVSK